MSDLKGYIEMMNRKRNQITIKLYPSTEGRERVVREYQSRFCTDDIYDNYDEFQEMLSLECVKFSLNDVSFNEAEAFAEPIRIMFPDQCVNLEDKDGSFCAHTTWNTQMDEFVRYGVFTEIGEKLKAKRMSEIESEF